MMQKKKVYYPALETMRIIAIAGVVAYHYYPQYLPGSFIGVDIFLALSGFLLARSLQAKYEEGVPLRYGAFLLKRVKRLWWPLFWMLLISVAFINLAAPSFLYNIRMTALSGLTFTNNWWQIQQGSSYFADFVHPSAYTHLWYVALIMQVLVVFPLVMRGGQRLLGNPYRLAGLLGLLALASALAMGVLYVPSGDPSRVYYGTDTRAFAVLIGAVGGLLSEARFGDLLGRRWPVLRRLPMGDVLTLVGLGGLMILAFRLMDQSSFTYRGGLVLAALASTVTFLGLTARSAVLGHLLSWKPLVALGNRTYAIYLWYYPVYAVSGTVPNLQKWPPVQWLILLALGLLTHSLAEGLLGRQLMVAVKGVPSLFSGGFSKAGLQDGIRRWPARALALLLLVLMVLSATIGLVRAPAGKNQTVAEMQAQLAETQKKLEARQKAAAREEVAEMGAIEGLSDEQRLFAAKADVTFIGDSILLSAAQPLAEAFPKAVIDGQVGRQLNQSGEVVDRLVQDNRLAPTVVIVLGSNGPFTEDQLTALTDKLGKRKLYFVNTHVARQWQDDVNAMLTAYVKAHKNARLIDWKSLIEQHPDWLYEDNTHCNPDGAQGFMQLVVQSLYEDSGQKAQKTQKDRSADDKAAKPSAKDKKN